MKLITLKLTVVFFGLGLIGSAQAILLDKIVAVYDNKSFTMSEVNRVLSNFQARTSISPQIYPPTKRSRDLVIRQFLNREVIKKKLSNVGYNVTDDQVESQIKNTEAKLGIRRQDLLNFLNGNNVSFEEYFEIIRETIEFNIFQSRIIAPMISITEQQIKNTFYKENTNNKTLSFKYDLVDFSFPAAKLNKRLIKGLPKVLKKYQVNGVLPPQYGQMSTNVLGTINEDGLTGQLSKLLKTTNEGEFTNGIKIGDQIHSFFVRKKDLVESSLYLKSKDRIRNQLYAKTAQELTEVWFEREYNNHYIKIFK